MEGEDFFGLFLVVTGLVHRHLLPGLDNTRPTVLIFFLIELKTNRLSGDSKEAFGIP